ncbi:DUF397 domain-containing protein [Kutzneria chonburiensis]|uniref:DUF397 domain-containing protein n=1 Tax=Kutzneria chonburiensis TaxID=1483604 RepID=A0ABV6MVN6_9PSEU|nr:DUF397 domain-containing protein [Kutzneria chonburiensis]
MEIAFVKSSFCHDGGCVEAAALPLGYVVLRDSKDPEGPALVFSHEEWAAFVAGVRNGEFNFSPR